MAKQSKSGSRSQGKVRQRAKTQRKNQKARALNIDWPFIGKLVVGGLILAALSGRLGPKAFIAANLAKKFGSGGLV